MASLRFTSPVPTHRDRTTPSIWHVPRLADMAPSTILRAIRANDLHGLQHELTINPGDALLPLLESGAAYPPLTYAVIHRRPRAFLRVLLDAGALLETPDAHGRTALYYLLRLEPTNALSSAIEDGFTRLIYNAQEEKRIVECIIELRGRGAHRYYMWRCPPCRRLQYPQTNWTQHR